MSQVYRARIARVISSVAAVGFSMSAAHALAAPTAPQGIWYTKGQESIIKVQHCASGDDAFCGTLVWLKEPNEKDGSPKRDTQNKDPAKRSQTILGLEILKDMKADDDHWTGKAYNPDDGKLYDITFKVKSDKAENDEADLRGCILGFLCQTETFTRADSVPGGAPAETGHRKRKGSKRDSANR